jgi:hypothetical protein
MPITFTTKTYADITMLNDIGETMLEMIGFGNLVPGAIAEQDVHQAFANLERNLVDENAKKKLSTDEDEKQPSVELSTRAIPLLELLKSASSNQNAVSWK